MPGKTRNLSTVIPVIQQRPLFSLRPQQRPDRSTKAGASAPATRRVAASTLEITSSAQRRPGHQPRRHVAFGGPGDRVSALNEGRGISPGDTRPGWPSAGSVDSAQRRPGHQPRRHAAGLAISRKCRQRSTKAGASAPATRQVPLDNPSLENRSTKAGASAPATRVRTHRHVPAAIGPLNEGRGISPGDTVAPLAGVPS